MLLVDTEVHLGLKVRAGSLGVNDLAAWVFEARNQVAREVVVRLLWEMQEVALNRVRRGKEEVACPGCGVLHRGEGSLLRRGSRPRTVRSSSGPIRFRLVQVTCRDCRKTWAPYVGMLGLRPRQRILEELERRLVDWVVELSYAKTSRLGRAWLGDSLSPRRLHRAVQRRGGEVEFTEDGPLEVLVADGTKVPAGPRERGEDVSVAFQIQGRTTRGRRVAVRKRVVGFSAGWRHWEETLATASEPELVVTDGEGGLAELVEEYFPGARHQRCEWHVPYSVAHALGLDGVGVTKRRALAKELSGILAQRGANARERYRAFVERLRPYPRAHTHLANAAEYVLYDAPSRERTSSVCEREMREINRRTDVGRRWSVSGISNLIRLRLAKRHNPDDYDRIWTKPRSIQWSLMPQHP